MPVGPSHTVLIVDDDALIRRVLARQLQSLGWNVIAVGSGAQAVQAAREAPVEVVLADLTMPGANGLEVLGRLSEICSARLVLMTGGVPSAADTRSRAYDRLHAVLQKPWNEHELRGALGMVA